MNRASVKKKGLLQTHRNPTAPVNPYSARAVKVDSGDLEASFPVLYYAGLHQHQSMQRVESGAAQEAKSCGIHHGCIPRKGLGWDQHVWLIFEEAEDSQLKIIETDLVQRLAGFLASIKNAKNGASSLLDHKRVLYGSALGNASSHSNSNLPAVLAGDGFRHGSHLVFDQTSKYPLTNLSVSILQRLGIETDRFASSTRTMRGLETA